MSVIYYYSFFAILIFCMAVWHYIAGILFPIRRKPTAEDIRFVKICITLERWLGYFILIYWFYYIAD
ncbi:hypothetical protein LBO01_22620 [Companilactobacillus paralimentarius]|uniref:Uncharacterized protein n=1 Tax=Companilactobacillus bobalius TaxID=2801451 RepID=A0A202FB77_9LACO|nr:hypothetical protein ATN92_01640 [Companilactobacillus bobalius]OVE97729.1 hypothetical protein LKACC16343_01611 [Companilactobacillus bobalius]GEO59133.1 hypothetical protein LBO01_22620 [Companilactobacillus paralimentarius]